MPRLKYAHKFKRFFIMNRWRESKYMRQSSWTFFGLSIWWSGLTSYAYKLHLFGVDVQFWFERKRKN